MPISAPRHHVQAIANTAAFHFGFIEQAGSSLYATLSQKVSSPEVLKITLSIGGDEICHFLEWVDFSGNGVQPPIAPFTDPTNGLHFPNFDAKKNPLLQTNLIFPVPCEFISPNSTPLRGNSADFSWTDRRCGRYQRLHQRRTVHRPIAGVFRTGAQFGARGGCGNA